MPATLLGRGIERLKGFVMTWAASSGSLLRLGELLNRARYNYAADIGDGRLNTIIQGCVGWIQRNFPDAPLRISKVLPDQTFEVVLKHPLYRLIRRPNSFYGQGALWSATLWDLILDGNAYWIKVRSAAGIVVELWYVPHWMMEPKWPGEDDPNVFISHYSYSPDGQKTFRLDIRDVVHFRDGIDPHNTRKGVAKFKTMVREIWTDDEGSNYAASIMRNAGLPGVVVMPKTGNTISEPQASMIKQDMFSKFTGDRRGEPMILRAEAEIIPLSFTPEQVNTRSLRRIPEERLSSVIGVPAILGGLGAGLDRSIYANMKEAKEQGYEGTIIPMHRQLADDLSRQMMVEYVDDVDDWRVDFDYSQVRALQEDADNLAKRAVTLAGGPVAKINEARSMVGLPPLEGGDLLYVPVNVSPTLEEDLFNPPEPAAAAAPAPAPDEEDDDEEELGRWYDDPDDMELWPEFTVKAVNASGDSIHAAILRYRKAELPRAQRAVLSMFRRQRNMAVQEFREIAKGLSTDGMEFKATPREQWAERLEARLADNFLASTRKTMTREHVRYLMGVQNVVHVALETDIPIDEVARTAFLQNAGLQITNISGRTLRQVRLALIAGVAAGEDAPAIARRLQSLAAFNEARASVVSRTELGQATNEASLLTYALSKVINEVVVHDGTDHDSPCADLAGKRMSLEAAAAVPRLEHPNAVLEGSGFRSYGALHEMIRARYAGPAVVLRSRASTGALVDFLTIGPNHPVLTRLGWVRAADIHEGDDVVYDTRAGDVGFGQFDLQQVPLIEHEFAALEPVSSHSFIPATRDDFHEDGVFCYGEVDVVRPYRQLLQVWDLGAVEPQRELLLVGANAKASLVAGLGAGLSSADRVLGAATGRVGGTGADADGAGHSFVFLRVAGAELVAFEGWAFDAQTECSLYCASGVVVSNCVRSFAPVIRVPVSTRSANGNGQGPQIVEPVGVA